MNHKILFLLMVFAYKMAIAQDTLRVHSGTVTDKFSVHKLDSITFLRAGSNEYDTVKVIDNFFTQTGPATWAKKVRKYKITNVDSITFKKADTLDYSSIHGLEVLTKAAYSILTSWYGKEEGMALAEMGTDLWTGGSESLIPTAINVAKHDRYLVLYDTLTARNENLARLWRQLYTGINLCNTGINAVKEQGLNMDDPKYICRAELHFLRAFYYWHLVENWGNVPLVLHPFYQPNIQRMQSPKPVLVPNATNSTVDAVYDLIQADLNFAINLLPATSNFGKINKSIAKAFLARIYLTKAYKDPSLFNQAKQLAEEIISNNNYSLVVPYYKLWDITNERNSEVIWAYDYENPTHGSDRYDANNNMYGYGWDILNLSGFPSNLRGNNNMHAYFVSAYDRVIFENNTLSILNRDIRNGTPFARFKPSRFLLDLFDGSKDARYNGSFQTVWYVNKAVTTGKLTSKVLYKDTALVIDKNVKENANYYTVNVYDTYNADGSRKGGNIRENMLFPSLVKHVDSTRGNSPNDVGSGNIQSAKDVVLFRLAEMHLIAAEAALGLGDLTAAKKHLDIIRTRAALPGADLSVKTEDISLDFILDEKAREFAGEYTRWFDLKRTGKLLERVKKFNPDAGAHIKEHHIVRPIPQEQLDFAPGLIQNLEY